MQLIPRAPVHLHLLEPPAAHFSPHCLLLVGFIFDPLPCAMAAKYSSGSSSGASTMRATLVLMLLLGAVVAAHARKVSCVNKMDTPITINGVTVAVNATALVDLVATVTVQVLDTTGALLSGTFLVPADVTQLVVTYVDGYLKVLVGAVGGLLSGLLNTLLGLVLGTIKMAL